mmetsp:Transcript_21990/g.87293  ORF Transcript_21990/g.87293 Transcript_21990/m.87293 type:complete len:211 (-) Transcript_21990:26-658(-)
MALDHRGRPLLLPKRTTSLRRQTPRWSACARRSSMGVRASSASPGRRRRAGAAHIASSRRPATAAPARGGGSAGSSTSSWRSSPRSGSPPSRARTAPRARRRPKRRGGFCRRSTSWTSRCAPSSARCATPKPPSPSPSASSTSPSSASPSSSLGRRCILRARDATTTTTLVDQRAVDGTRPPTSLGEILGAAFSVSSVSVVFRADEWLLS